MIQCQQKINDNEESDDPDQFGRDIDIRIVIINLIFLPFLKFSFKNHFKFEQKSNQFLCYYEFNENQN